MNSHSLWPQSLRPSPAGILRSRAQRLPKWRAGLAVGWALATSLAAAPPALPVTTTTTMITDLVGQVGGDRVAVQGLMGPGVDPHLYKPAASDVIKLQKAEVIFFNGLLLEGKMTDLLDRMGRIKKHVYAVTDRLPRDRLMQPASFEGHYDPHVWFDVALWAECVDTVVAGLSAARPGDRPYFEARGKEVWDRMHALHRWVLAQAALLPAERRMLVTSHDAYGYFGRAYGFTVVGLQGISTVTEAGLADMAKMVDFIKAKRIPAVFVESSVSPAALQRISEDAGVRIGGELFSDAMGTPGRMENGHDLGTYEGMVRHNMTTIVEGLRQAPPAADAEERIDLPDR